MEVAVLYYEFVADPVQNRERLLAGLDAALADADLVVGPETATVAPWLDPPAVRERAEPLDGETVTRARRCVETRGGAALFGLAERDGVDRYDACVLLEAGRQPRVYRQPEYPHTHGWTTAHGERRVFDTAAGRVAPVICGELAFPATRSAVADSDADILAAPATWGESSDRAPLVERWADWSRELSLPLAVSNGYSPASNSDRAFAFDGPAAVVSGGSVLARTDTPGAVVSATV
jgi:predicted amidohydrolase